MFKKLFGREDPTNERKDLTTEDLIVLERWDEAILQLQARIQANPLDLHAHLKLAEVHLQSGHPHRAVDEYVFVADSYIDDGFYDKAIALLGKLTRMVPGDAAIEASVRKAQQLKDLEHRSTMALEGLLSSQEERNPLARLSLIEAQQVWQSLSTTEVVLRLPGEQLRRLFASSTLIEPEAGEILVERGSKVEQLYFFASGEGEALLDQADGRPILLRTFGTGDILGDRSLLEHQPWPATYRITAPSRIFKLDAAGLEKALQGNPDPRLLLDALRSRRHDHDVAAAVRKLVASPA